jgi:hypothetical protein
MSAAGGSANPQEPKMTQTQNIVFFAGETVQITGYQQECDCSHCGRPLKVGVKLAGFPGAFGADCLAKASETMNYYGKKWRYDAATLRERGIIAGKGQKCIEHHGFNESHFRFILQKPLQSI